jgi:hypothetical protein
MDVEAGRLAAGREALIDPIPDEPVVRREVSVPDPELPLAAAE